MTQYAVCHADGIVGFQLRIPYEGITVADGRLRWKSQAGPVEQALSDLVQVRLYTIPAGKYRNAGRGELTFRDRRSLSIFGTGSLGMHDPVHASAYRGLLRDLHAQIPAEARPHIRFTMERPRNAAWFWPVMALIVGVAAIVLVREAGAAGLLGLAILLGLMSLRFVPLFLSGSGGGGPGGDRYDPDAVPDHLMP